ncbi:MAG: hypothetical protein ACRC8S_18725 [Fimbriiglobus sp.]
MLNAPIECRLSHVPFAQDHPHHTFPTRGEVELVNTSSVQVAIVWDMHPFQYLDLVVTDSEGRVWSSSHYGGIFSHTGYLQELRLKTGEFYRASVGLLTTLPRPYPAGRYIIRAVFGYAKCS